VASNASAGSSQIIRNVLVNWVAYAVTIGIGFFMSPFLIHQLGDPVYGVWVLISSLVGYLGLLDLGFSPSIVKSVAEHRARGDDEAINRLATGGLIIFGALGVICLVLSSVVALCFNRLFHTPLGDTAIACIVFIIGLDIAISFPASVFAAVLRGCQRYDLYASASTLMVLARSVLVVIFVVRGYGLLALAIVTFLLDMARLVYLIGCAYRLNPALRIGREYFHRESMRGLSTSSAYFFLISIGTQLNFFTDTVVIGLYFSTAAVTTYFIANRLITYLRELVMEMIGVLMPSVTNLHATQDKARLTELHVLSTKYTLLIALPIAGVFLILGDVFITLWVGPGYSQSVLLLRILTIAIVASLAISPTERVLMGSGKHEVVARFTILQAVINLLLSLLLVKPLGLAGVALATTTSLVGFVLALFPIYFRSYLQAPLGNFLRRSMLLPCLVQAPLIAALFFLKSLGVLTSLLWFFVLVGAAFLFYAVLVGVTCLSTAERRAFTKVIGKFHRTSVQAEG
jgi:O-antigen/teichoic acid export membrane protein